MAEDNEDEGAKPFMKAAAAGLNPVFAAAGKTDDARVYLRKQSELTDLQIDSLRKLDEYELSHLRWRRFNDQMKGAMQMMLVAVGALIVAGIAAAILEASQADGIVVEAFSVPPQFAQAGIGGEVVADDLTARIAAIRDFANANSLARSKDVRQDRDQDVKVDIADTGISLGQLWHYLRAWLGHERHLSGNLRVGGDGRIGLTVALDGDDAVAFSGPSGELGVLEQQAAEHIFAIVDPTNDVLYLSGKGRSAESLAAAARGIGLFDKPAARADAWALWANRTHYVTGDLRLTLARARIGMAIDSKSAGPHLEMLAVWRALGRDEDALEQAREISGLQEGNDPAWQDSHGVAYVLELGTLIRYVETGDFAQALSEPCPYLCSFGSRLLRRAEYAARMHDAVHSRALIGEALASGSADPEYVERSHYFSDAAVGNWRAAAVDAQAYAAAFGYYSSKRLRTTMVLTEATPLLAYALARSGDFAAAHSAIDATPPDCYECVRARGRIAAFQKNRGGSAYWFGDAVTQAPSIPFAYADWGEMLLVRGSYDAAIARFEQANRKGPHFADPLEMWGEALMAKNRSDLALAKFEEADNYAPNWGRLHLEWGNALTYSGNRAEAKKQFAIAQRLDLSANDKSQLRAMENKLP